MTATGGMMTGTGSELGPHVMAYPQQARSLLRVLVDQSESRPDADWLVIDSRDRLSFRAARDETSRVGSAVRRGITPGDTVALLMRNRIAFMPVLLGAQAGGGKAVPLNPELRGSMLSRLLSRSEARVLVVEAGLVDRLIELDGLAEVSLVVVSEEDAADSPLPESIHGVPVRGYGEWRNVEPLDLAAAIPDSSRIAMLMFTSGTSGGSKAAVWTHHYLFLAAACVADALDFGPSEVLSTPLQMCHIAGLQVFAGASLVAGCTAHLKSTFSSSRWWDEIAADNATFAMLMGPMTAAIMRAVPRAPQHRLHTLYVLPQPANRAEFEYRYGTTIVWQGWGMTEIFPHLPRLHPIDDVPADTIGPPPRWVDFGVVDEFDRLLPPDTLGEMVYRPLIPHAMASGYYNDHEATARAFRNFMFHTGDLGYYDTAGRIHFVMRSQDGIRVRGENVSAVELESIALTHPNVLEVAAYALPDEDGQQEIKLDVVVIQDIALTALHIWLEHELPRYMVPRWLEKRNSLPRTPSQRVEKYRLAAQGTDRPTVLDTPRRRR
ncbi:AMP-binding protein [Rhodococcoides yunnanense]|uniref:AMP-binding protein n=1 Tax=Rhodococcoides yunnanense TaxID=278209 RepID=UPI0022B0D9C4|nr:AMP-binding protein [Rhodococcus yunnanensis]MCZ4278772.1 AMP-binding protein [Rhodococcus yunnanensis]